MKCGRKIRRQYSSYHHFQFFIILSQKLIFHAIKCIPYSAKGTANKNDHSFHKDKLNEYISCLFLKFKKKLCSLPHMYTLALFICADIFLVNEMNGGALWSYRTKKGKKINKSKDKGEKAWLTAFNRDLSLHFTGSEWIFESILPKEQLFKTLNQLASQIIWTDAPQNTLEVFIYLFIF